MIEENLVAVRWYDRLRMQEGILLTEQLKQYVKVAGCVLTLLIGIIFAGAGTVRSQEVPGDNRTESVQQPAEADDRSVSVDFNDVDLAVFVKFISELTGKNFVVDQQVKGKVTIISPSKISVAEAYQVFEAVLEVHGYTTVQSGAITKIVKDMDARSKSVETGLAIPDESDAQEDKVVTQIIPLKYADPNEVKQLFVPLVSKAGIILSYPSTNMLIVTDYHSNIKRLMDILTVIDVTGIGRQVSVTPLEYSDATKVVPILENIFQSRQDRRKPGDDGVRMVADDRSNAIVLLASEVETKQIKQLIALLDRKVPHGKERIHVVYLKNAVAEELAEVLTSLPKGDEKKAGVKKTPVISQDVSITADSATNSLIIMAERDDFLVLQEIIQKLDIPRSMVYIECLIVEVNVNKNFNLGVEWLAGGESSFNDKDGAYLGGFGGASDTGYQNIYGMAASSTGLATLPAGFSVGAFYETITIGGVMFPNVAAIVQAFKKDKDVHILSTPQIMTTDNTEASITVGKNIPYLTRIGTTDASETYSNYEYNDVGIMLTIKPQINENRLIRLDISQEVTRLDQLSTLAADRPSTLKRTIKTNVIVHDQHTVVIGGLIDDSLTKVDYRVPCLGDIPLFGWLFKSLSDSSDRTNLFVFLTPHVIKSLGEADAVLRDKQSELDAVKSGGFNLFPTDQSSGKDENQVPDDMNGSSDIEDMPSGETSSMSEENDEQEPESMVTIDDIPADEDTNVIKGVYLKGGSADYDAPAEPGPDIRQGGEHMNGNVRPPFNGGGNQAGAVEENE